MLIHPKLQHLTKKITLRSQPTRDRYLDNMAKASVTHPKRQQLACGNLAHTMAACSPSDKDILSKNNAPNIAIISAYNDMLSAHKPYENYPHLIREIARKNGATAQLAGGVPAMCDGITQGQTGMELSLFSRDVIAMSTAVSLSHQVFDGILCLGICDKIVPGLLIGALRFGYLPLAFIPAGPMPSGISNKDKANTREQFAEGKIDKSELLKVESASYHSAGTCTFYGTANSNQMLMEIMGLQLPGSSFIPPATNLRYQLTIHAVENQLNQLQQKQPLQTLADIITVETIVNGMVGLLATGGSTNLTIHLIAIAKAAGIIVNWQDISELSTFVPLLCRIYPNGEADINHFNAAGGMGYLIHQLLKGDLLHPEVNTIIGQGLTDYIYEPILEKNPEAEILRDNHEIESSQAKLLWNKINTRSQDENILRPLSQPFSQQGGLKLLTGNLGRSVVKVSAVNRIHQKIKAPAKIFNSQQEFKQRFNSGELRTDFIAVIRFQGPRANGMPELHQLMPLMGSLQDQGFQVAIVTDGRLSGASGKVLAAIHLTPEAKNGGAIAKVRENDLIKLDAITGTLDLLIDENKLAQRESAIINDSKSIAGVGRELFSCFREKVSSAEDGASIFNFLQ